MLDVIMLLFEHVAFTPISYSIGMRAVMQST
jgi:hypothetical protein